MKTFVLAVVLSLAACSEDEALTPQCKTVLEHIVEISPQGQGQDARAIVAALPVEDRQSCKATEPEVLDCIGKASDVAGVKKCLPSGEVLACMQKAGKAKRPDVRAKCWGGDAKAADDLKVE